MHSHGRLQIQKETIRTERWMKLSSCQIQVPDKSIRSLLPLLFSHFLSLSLPVFLSLSLSHSLHSPVRPTWGFLICWFLTVAEIGGGEREREREQVSFNICFSVVPRAAVGEGGSDCAVQGCNDFGFKLNITDRLSLQITLQLWNGWVDTPSSRDRLQINYNMA